MDRLDYFKKAIVNNACKKREWVTMVFSEIIKSGEGEDYPYRLKIDNGNYSFLTEDSGWQEITDARSNKPLLDWLEPITLNQGELVNYNKPEPLVTTPGNILFNYLVLCLPFGNTIPFVTGRINMDAIGKRILELLVDDPEDDGLVEGKITCKQFIQSNENALALVAYAEDNVTPITPKSVTGNPERHKLKEALIEKHKHELTNPSVVAKIGSELEKIDLEYLQGDPSYQFYMSKKSKLVGNSRKRRFYMFGGEAPFEDGTTVTFISPSLEEGIDTNHLQTMFNSQRAGSFSRGHQTQKGGEKTKTIYRMLGSVRVEKGDCGDTVGIPVTVGDNAKELIGYYYLVNKKPVLITEENISSLKGTEIRLRDPMACKQDSNKKEGELGKGRNICEVCAGLVLSELPEGIPAASAAVGGRFLTAALKRMHNTTLQTAKWDYKENLH